MKRTKTFGLAFGIFVVVAMSCSDPQAMAASARKSVSPANAGKDGASKSDTKPETKESSSESVSTSTAISDVEQTCLKDMKKIVGRDDAQMADVCKQAKVIPGCRSVGGVPIYHYDRPSPNPNGKRILTFALIHGDEGPSGAVARAWMERLNKISPQNSWRIIPVLNPDGWEKRTRVNANKIDLNRNFPTKNWKEESTHRWEVVEDKDPRRFPGTTAASEPETRCAISHIDEFNPTFIISVHTPFGVLDFDGPRMKFPEYSDLPWFSLGNFPGSMGRYMWGERQIPVLTIELKGADYAHRLDQFDRLQDVTGVVAIQSEKILRSPEFKKKMLVESEKKHLESYPALGKEHESGRKLSRIK